MARKPDFGGLMDNADDAAALLAAMAHRTRLLALCKLSQRETGVGALARELGASQSATSLNLGTLKEQGLVSGRRDGTAIYYGVASPHVERILATLAGIYLGSGAWRQQHKRAAGATKTTVSRDICTGHSVFATPTDNEVNHAVPTRLSKPDRQRR